MYILGAGMAGCLAGVMFPNATVIERQSALPANHDAVLRFRTDEISKATGIPFKQVQVYKGIWYDGEFVPVAPRYINEYSMKVTGGAVLSRSIAKVTPAPETRYIAPPDFQQQLAGMLGDRLVLGKTMTDISKNEMSSSEIAVDFLRKTGDAVISTLPMPIINNITESTIDVNFKHSEIYVTIYEVENCDVYQSVYYPDPTISVYRASLTGNRLIVESTTEPHPFSIGQVHKSFGLNPATTTLVTSRTQPFGKIVPIDNTKRKDYILQLSRDLEIYSLGRFACWREGVMMDDVYKDIFQIRQLINRHPYDGAVGRSDES